MFGLLHATFAVSHDERRLRRKISATRRKSPAAGARRTDGRTDDEGIQHFHEEAWMGFPYFMPYAHHHAPISRWLARTQRAAILHTTCLS